MTSPESLLQLFDDAIDWSGIAVAIGLLIEYTPDFCSWIKKHKWLDRTCLAVGALLVVGGVSGETYFHHQYSKIARAQDRLQKERIESLDTATKHASERAGNAFENARAASDKATKAESELADAQRQAGEATRQAAEANEETERLRKLNLVADKALMQRVLGETSVSTGGLEQFAGTPIVIQPVPDFEAIK